MLALFISLVTARARRVLCTVNIYTCTCMIYYILYVYISIYTHTHMCVFTPRTLYIHMLYFVMGKVEPY
jgi:hypothetical protein